MRSPKRKSVIALSLERVDATREKKKKWDKEEP